ncbi:MAG TPA: ATP-grasp domain-containing protein [Kofleriaceae bacterium]|jgi:biotin carboxylase|nr:ATP-grasp domain-containing protein [Kofleriaceae bacterium]
MSSVIFVGLRPYQLEATAEILGARRAGLRVALLTDRVPPGTVTSLVDDVEITEPLVPDKAVAAAAQLARRTGARGVVTWADRDVELVARIARHLGLPGLSADAARLVRNKHAGRLAFASRPDLIPRFRTLRGGDLREAIAEIGFPAILKPLTGSGSKGIFEVRQESEAIARFDQLRRYTTGSGDPMFSATADQWLYEEYLEGTEHSVEGLVQNGEVRILAITDKVTVPPHHIELEHIQPTALDEAARAAVDDLTRTTVRLLGLDDCTFHLECKVDAGGRARLVEVAGRPGGGMIASHLVPMSTGIDMCEQAVRIAAGLAISLPDRRPHLYAGARSVFADRAGRIEDIRGLGAALGVRGVTQAAILIPPGGQTRLPPDDFMSQRVLTVIATAGDRDSLHGALVESCDAVQIVMAEATTNATLADQWDRMQRIRSMDEARAAVLGPGFVGQSSNVTPRYLRLLAERLGLDERSRVLDAGAGSGGLTLALADAVGCAVVGLDLSPEAVQVARERLGHHPRARAGFHVGDLAATPEDLGEFDAILSFGSSYWSEPDRAAEHWAGRLRRPHGTLVMLFTRVYAAQSDRDREVGLQRGFFEPHLDWEGALDKAGFTVASADLTDLDGLYFRAYLSQLRARQSDLKAQMGEADGEAYIGMFEQLLSYYDRGLLRRIEITATLSPRCVERTEQPS